MLVKCLIFRFVNEDEGGFFREFQDNPDGSQSIIFTSPFLCIPAVLTHVEEIHFDSIYDLVPPSPKFQELFVIHIVVLHYVSFSIIMFNY